MRDAGVDGGSDAATTVEVRADAGATTTTPSSKPVLGARPGVSARAPSGTSGDARMAHATSLETAGKLAEAATEFEAAAAQFEAEGKFAQGAAAHRRAAEANEHLADQLLGKGAPNGGPAAPKPNVAPAPNVAPGDATIPPGRYNCHGLAPNGIFAVIRRVQINDASHYVYFTLNDREQLPGTYRLDAAKGKVTWLTGPLAGRQGDWVREPDKKENVLVVVEGAIPTAFRCYLSTS